MGVRAHARHLVALGVVDAHVARGVHEGARVRLVERALDRDSVGDVELRVRRRAIREASRFARAREGTTERS